MLCCWATERRACDELCERKRQRNARITPLSRSQCWNILPKGFVHHTNFQRQEEAEIESAAFPPGLVPCYLAIHIAWAFVAEQSNVVAEAKRFFEVIAILNLFRYKTAEREQNNRERWISLANNNFLSSQELQFLIQIDSSCILKFCLFSIFWQVKLTNYFLTADNVHAVSAYKTILPSSVHCRHWSKHMGQASFIWHAWVINTCRKSAHPVTPCHSYFMR